MCSRAAHSVCGAYRLSTVMPGLVPGIHALRTAFRKTWMAGTSPAMTKRIDAITSEVVP